MISARLTSSIAGLQMSIMDNDKAGLLHKRIKEDAKQLKFRCNPQDSGGSAEMRDESDMCKKQKT